MRKFLWTAMLVLILASMLAIPAAAAPGNDGCPNDNSGYVLRPANNPARIAADKNGDGSVCVKRVLDQSNGKGNNGNGRNIIDNNAP